MQFSLLEDFPSPPPPRQHSPSFVMAFRTLKMPEMPLSKFQEMVNKPFNSQSADRPSPCRLKSREASKTARENENFECPPNFPKPAFPRRLRLKNTCCVVGHSCFSTRPPGPNPSPPPFGIPWGSGKWNPREPGNAKAGARTKKTREEIAPQVTGLKSLRHLNAPRC